MPNSLLVALFFACSLHLSAQQYPNDFKRIGAISGGLTSPVDAGDRFGIMSAAIGDLNDDGVPDIAVGATNHSGFSNGGVTVIFMNTDGSAKSSVLITNSESGQSDSFGYLPVM